jgi:hypothetical protein
MRIISIFLSERRIPLFDEKIILKEDYDFTAQHLDVHGKVARLELPFPLRFFACCDFLRASIVSLSKVQPFFLQG